MSAGPIPIGMETCSALLQRERRLFQQCVNVCDGDHSSCVNIHSTHSHKHHSPSKWFMQNSFIFSNLFMFMCLATAQQCKSSHSPCISTSMTKEEKSARRVATSSLIRLMRSKNLGQGPLLANSVARLGCDEGASDTEGWKGEGGDWDNGTGLELVPAEDAAPEAPHASDWPPSPSPSPDRAPGRGGDEGVEARAGAGVSAKDESVPMSSDDADEEADEEEGGATGSGGSPDVASETLCLRGLVDMVTAAAMAPNTDEATPEAASSTEEDLAGEGAAVPATASLGCVGTTTAPDTD